MSISLFDAKFLDSSKQPRKIKCTRNPLKLIIKEEGEKKTKEDKQGSSTEKPSNLFQNILKNTKFRLPKKLAKKEVKSEEKMEEKLVFKLPKKEKLESNSGWASEQKKEIIQKVINKEVKTVAAESKETKTKVVKPQETKPKPKLPPTTQKMSSSGLISQIFNQDPKPATQKSAKPPKVKSPPPKSPPPPTFKTRFSWSTDTISFHPKFQKFPDLYLARFCEQEQTLGSTFNLSFGDEVSGVPDQEATISESNGFFRPFKLKFDQHTRKHQLTKEMLELAISNLPQDVKLVMTISVETVSGQILDKRRDSSSSKSSSKPGSRRGSLSEKLENVSRGLTRRPSFTESMKSLTSSMASLVLNENKREIKRRNSFDKNSFSEEVPEPIVTCSSPCTVLIKMQQGECVHAPAWISCQKR